ncbi:hypothetical protein KHQ89_02995 [Mycoplasmatota bacterium]|nr:hypothetical protein KHQ89_02995 [Mycoplasmatota bacterium]
MIFKKTYKYLVLVLLILIISSCQKEKISIIVPYGSPSYTTMYLDDYDVSIIQGADPLVAAFGSNNYDVIVAPTNLGAKFYSSSKTYQLVASIVWGNMYLISHSPINFDQINDKNIYAFGQSQTPDIILNYILNAHEANPNIIYLSSASEVIASFMLNPNDIYLVAEPQYSILDNTDIIYAQDMQEAYEKISGLNPYPQASIFVNKNLSDRQVEDIENDFKNSINQLKKSENKKWIADELDIEEAIISKVIERSHISYLNAEDAKYDIELYLNLIIDFNNNLLSKLPEDSFYR